MLEVTPAQADDLYELITAGMTAGLGRHDDGEHCCRTRSRPGRARPMPRRRANPTPGEPGRVFLAVLSAAFAQASGRCGAECVGCGPAMHMPRSGFQDRSGDRLGQHDPERTRGFGHVFGMTKPLEYQADAKMR